MTKKEVLEENDELLEMLREFRNKIDEVLDDDEDRSISSRLVRKQNQNRSRIRGNKQRAL